MEWAIHYYLVELVNGFTPFISKFSALAISKFFTVIYSYLNRLCLLWSIFFCLKVNWSTTLVLVSSRDNCLGLIISLTKLIARPSSLSMSIILPSSFNFWLKIVLGIFRLGNLDLFFRLQIIHSCLFFLH